MNIKSVLGTYSVSKSQVKKDVASPPVSFKSQGDTFVSFRGSDPKVQIQKKIDKIPSQIEKDTFLSIFTEWENSCSDGASRKELYKIFKSKLVTEDNGNKYNPFFVKLVNLGFSFDEIRNILIKNPEIINRNGDQKVLDLILHVSNFCGVDDRCFYGCHIKEFYDGILSALDIVDENDPQPVDVSGIVNNYISPLQQDNNHRYFIQRHLFSDGSKCYKFSSVSSEENNEQRVYFDIDQNNSDDFLTVYNFYDENGSLLNNTQKSVVSEKALKEIFKAYINTYHVNNQDNSFEIKPIIVSNNDQYYFFPFHNGELPTIFPISANVFNEKTEDDRLMLLLFKQIYEVCNINSKKDQEQLFSNSGYKVDEKMFSSKMNDKVSLDGMKQINEYMYKKKVINTDALISDIIESIERDYARNNSSQNPRFIKTQNLFDYERLIPIFRIQ